MIFRLSKLRSKASFIILGIAALVWFLIRVVPKPSRAAYPCQRAAFPIASAFVLWLTATLGGLFLIRFIKNSYRNHRFVTTGCAAISLVFLIGCFLVMPAEKNTLRAETITEKPNVISTEFTADPYEDNRVVRIYDEKVTDYDFNDNTSAAAYQSIDKKVLRTMLVRSLYEISGQQNEIAAWKKIMTGTETGSLDDKKVTIKVNFNATIQKIPNAFNNSPAMIIVLAQSLEQAGFKQGNISFFDCSRPFPDDFKAEIRAAGLGKIRLQGNKDGMKFSDKMIFLSDNKDFMRDEKRTDEMPVPQILIDADYYINLHLLKIHSAGVTGALKNHFGFAENVSFFMHNKGVPGYGKAYIFPDIVLNEELHTRYRLNIAEAVFGGQTPNTLDKFSNTEFFPNGLPSSLIVSRSPFYHDAVMYGFAKAEYQTIGTHFDPKYQKQGTDIWLKNCAERYPKFNYDQAKFIDITNQSEVKKDLVFEKIDYRSIFIDSSLRSE